MEHLSMMTASPVEAPTAALGAGPGFVVELEAFSGPLDLLLHLLREEQLEIADIPIARIADQFLQAIHELGLNQAADYLDMASRLVRLKAQMLLPRRPEEDGWEDPRAELVRRLLEYQQIREVAIWMGRAADRRAEQLARGYLPPPPVLHRVVARPLDVETATRRIETLLADQEEIRWLDALGSRPTIVDVLSTLLALLELAKRGTLRLLQPTPFSPMVIARDTARPAA
jgi:segregation and condensation protein A